MKIELTVETAIATGSSAGIAGRPGDREIGRNSDWRAVGEIHNTKAVNKIKE